MSTNSSWVNFVTLFFMILSQILSQICHKRQFRGFKSQKPD